MKRIFGHELTHAGLLLLIGLLCVSVGYYSMRSLDGLSEAFTVAARVKLTVAYFAGNIGFLAYRQYHQESRARLPDQNQTTAMLLYFISLVIIGAISIDLENRFYHLGFMLLLYTPMIAFCSLSYSLLFLRSATPRIETRFDSFPNQIFIPAFLFCMTNFAIGAHLNNLNLNSASLGVTVALVSLQLVVIGIYFLGDWVTDKVFYFTLPATTIVLSVLIYFLSGHLLSVQVALAVLLTYLLGVAEVAKNIFFSARGAERATVDSSRTKLLEKVDTYTAGANWSSVVFPLLFLLAPALYLSMSFLPVVVTMYAIVLVWMFIDNAWKKQIAGFGMSMAIGYLAPAAILFSFNYATMSTMKLLENANETSLLLALIGLVSFSSGLLRLGKDFLGVQLHKFVDGMWQLQTYRNIAGNLILLLVANLLMCVLITAAWFALVIMGHFANQASNVIPSQVTSDGTTASLQVQYGARLIMAAMASNILALMALLIALSWPKKLAEVRVGAELLNKIGADVPTVAQKLMIRVFAQLQWVIKSGRLPVSAVAGLASAVYVAQTSLGAGFASVGFAFVSLTIVTMVGFILNDAADIDKDQRQGKDRPIANGDLPVATALAYAAALGVFAVGLAAFAFSMLQGVILAGILLLLYGYSPVARAAPLIKGLYTGALCLCPFGFAYSVSGVMPAPHILIGVYAYIIAREAVLDAQDIKGDVASGMKTIAYYLGQRKTIIVGWFLMFAALVYGLLQVATLPSQVLFVSAIAVQLYAITYFSKDDSETMNATRVPMLASAFAICFAS